MQSGGCSRIGLLARRSGTGESRVGDGHASIKRAERNVFGYRFFASIEPTPSGLCPPGLFYPLVAAVPCPTPIP